MTKSFTIIENEYHTSKKIFPNNYIPTVILLFICIFILLTTTIIFAMKWRNVLSSQTNKYAVDNGTIAFPPILPNDGKYIQWTILHLNDVYEMLPLDQGRKGGLARVARVRQLLLEENPQTLTILSGDFLSPSALSQAKVNGRILNGRQMIQSFNTLGLDFVTFGNHEFDLNERELIARMNESTFTWISSNVFRSGTNQSFSISIPYHIVTIDQLKIVFIGLTIDDNHPYVHIINKTSLIPFVKEFLKSISNVKYDVLIALTHLDLQSDIELAENIPEINLILGGHDHEDYYFLRGSQMTPIYKADGNAFTVYIHRCAFNLDTKRLRLYSTLAKITSELLDEPKTAEVVNYWYHLGVKGFEEMGFKANETVCCLSSGVELDGRSVSVRNGATLLTKYICSCLLQSTEEDSTVIGIVNSGSIRIDDILRGKINEYDILRVLPFGNNLISVLASGEIVGNVLRRSMELVGSGMFLSYCGINTPDEGKRWIIDGKDISKSDVKYRIVTTDYVKENSDLNGSTIEILRRYNVTHAKSLINYLKRVFPAC